METKDYWTAEDTFTTAAVVISVAIVVAGCISIVGMYNKGDKQQVVCTQGTEQVVLEGTDAVPIDGGFIMTNSKGQRNWFLKSADTQCFSMPVND